jgi:hypothetical protein
MRFKNVFLLASWMIVGQPLFAQPSTSFVVPRTEFGHPDFQGVWAINFVTLMERPMDINTLVVEPELAESIARKIQDDFREGNTDPEMLWTRDMGLAQVNGEFRTSVITRPSNGKVPYSELGKSLSLEQTRLDEEGFDGPEQRELAERCLAGLGGPPAAVLPVELPRLFVQTKDHVVIYMEDVAGLRIITLDSRPPENLARRFEGDSRGHWEGDTLVVVTDHFRYDYPTRNLITSYMVVGEDTRVTERFTRISAAEILYQFTVEDDALYTEPWSGEYPLSWIGGHSYSYECHEGNYSLPGILRGGQTQVQ